ncbi:4-vinyl reductase [Chroococcidiopsis sp. FACHB-1243]|uniref:V4R domain-containing protein n=1 Tax=Chroococcidiopsis sp. [FACHB-1243] TaxID=2692781 RepID=UPI0017839079|nr:V4R domain-containing protein [Chroococcidiopsis sp. [FACHB-1243]]MBD2306646.1 4-vinyl reductase [Chroococcidiopsis sp. [FACHB-1243]]
MVISSDNLLFSTHSKPGTQAEYSLKKKYPQKHNHYSFDDYFQFQPNTGIVTDWHDQRHLFATEDFIVGLIEGLEEEVGSASTVLMYNIGFEWGTRDAKFFQQWFEQEYGKNVKEVNSLYMLEAWWWPFTAQGWGNWEVDMSDHKNGFMFVNIFDSAVARTLGDVGKPVCHIYAGLFAGFFSDLVKKTLSCIEIQCYSMGETYCKFLLGTKDRIDAAAFWHNEGATARDIEKRLRHGERLG